MVIALLLIRCKLHYRMHEAAYGGTTYKLGSHASGTAPSGLL